MDSQESASRVADALYGWVVDEPAATLSGGLIYQCARQTVALLKDLLHDLLLAAARSDKCDLYRVCDNWQRQGDSLRRRLRRVLNWRDPSARLTEKRVAGEQTACVAVGSAAQKEQVEDGQLDRVAAREGADEQLLILVGQFLGVVQVFRVDRMDGRLAQVGGDLVKQLLL